MKKTALVFLLLSAVSTAAVYAGGVSVENSKVLDRWTFRIGGFLTGLDTNIRLDSPTGGEGTTINLEDDLGFSSSESVPRLDLAFIIGKRHQVAVGWYKTDRDTSTTLRREIEWGDETFPLNIGIAAFYKTEFLTLAYTYWFYSSEKTALGVTGGLTLANLSAGLGLSAIGQGATIEEDIGTDVPVPTLGFSVHHYLGSKFVLHGGLGYIAFDIEDWKGDVIVGAIGVEHRTWKNFGFGLGYSLTNYDVDAESSDFLGNFEYRIGGFEIYVRAAW